MSAISWSEHKYDNGNVSLILTPWAKCLQGICSEMGGLHILISRNKAI
jgi:hypothetical protein